MIDQGDVDGSKSLAVEAAGVVVTLGDGEVNGQVVTDTLGLWLDEEEILRPQSAVSGPSRDSVIPQANLGVVHVDH